MRKILPKGLGMAPAMQQSSIELVGGLTESQTAHAGVSLLIETGRRSGVVAAAERGLHTKKSGKGLGEGQMVEAFVLLSALGGECLEDFEVLRRDVGLGALTGYALPPAPTARQWLERFHDGAAIAARPAQGSFIPVESPGLAGLRTVVERSVRAYVEAVAVERTVTLDVDAHLVESHKRTALYTYEGFPGYQPVIVEWAETGLVLADEFRDGNVPASRELARMVDQAYQALPARPGGWQVRVRSDSAAYEYEALDHWQERGWKFAVSADMSPQLRAEIEALPLEAWQPWAQEPSGVVREWAEVAYVPSRETEKRDTQPYRYVAIRVRGAQGVLFADGATVKHFAVVSNDWEMDGQALLEWHRGKAGTVEHAHRVIKNELAGGVWLRPCRGAAYPSGKFGANAAWLRLQVLTNNLLELMKVVALEPEYRRARPKRLRFAIFTQFGRVVQHARQCVVRMSSRVLEALIWPGQRRLSLAWPTA